MKYKHMQFWEGDDGGEFGGDPGGDSSRDPIPPSTPSLKLDPESLKQFGGIIAEQFKQNQPAPQPKTYTPEEIKEAQKKLKFWEPGDDWFTRYDNLETRKQAILEQRDGHMAQFVAIAQAMLDEERNKWEEKFKPVQSIVEQRAQAEQVERFETKYPALAKPKLADFRNAIGQKLVAAGAFNGKSEDESFDILANAMADAIKEFQPEFNLGAPTPNTPKMVRSHNGITPVVHGSGGGGSGSGNGDGDNGGRKAPKAASLFPKIRG